jgi:hypothetical protein
MGRRGWRAKPATKKANPALVPPNTHTGAAGSMTFGNPPQAAALEGVR